jgi:hypothetical protein
MDQVWSVGALLAASCSCTTKLGSWDGGRGKQRPYGTVSCLILLLKFIISPFPLEPFLLPEVEWTLGKGAVPTNDRRSGLCRGKENQVSVSC